MSLGLTLRSLLRKAPVSCPLGAGILHDSSQKTAVLGFNVKNARCAHLRKSQIGQLTWDAFPVIFQLQQHTEPRLHRGLCHVLPCYVICMYIYIYIVYIYIYIVYTPNLWRWSAWSAFPSQGLPDLGDAVPDFSNFTLPASIELQLVEEGQPSWAAVPSCSQLFHLLERNCSHMSSVQNPGWWLVWGLYYPIYWGIVII